MSLGWRTEVKRPGNAAIRQNSTNRNRPTIALRLCRIADQRPPPRRREVRTGSVLAGELTSRAVMSSPLRPCAGVEPEGREVTQQYGDQHRQRDHQEKCLEQRIVGTHGGFVEA